MGLLDEAIREHLDLKRKHGADEAEIARQEAEVFGAGPEQGAEDPYAVEELSEGGLEAPPDRAAEAGITGDREEPEFEWHGFGSTDLEVPDYVTGGDEGAGDETRVDVGGGEARLEEERPPEVTDAPTELFQPLDVDRSEEPDALEEPDARAAEEEAAGEELSSAAASADETVLYEAPPIAEDEEPAAEGRVADEPAAEEPLAEEPAPEGLEAEEPAADELSEGVSVDEAFAAEPSLPDEAAVAPSDDELELGGEAPEDASEAVEEKPLDDAPEAVGEDALAVAETIEESEPPPDEETEPPLAAETMIEAVTPEEEEFEEEEQRLEHEPAAEDELLEHGPVDEDAALEEEEHLAEETELSDLSASLEPSPFARPEEPAEAFDAEATDDSSDDAGDEPVPRAPDEEAWDEVGIVEEGEPEAAPAPDDTAYLPPEERPLYEPVPDAEARPEEPLDIPPPATEFEPGPEPKPLAEAGDTALEPEPPEAELDREPPETEIDVPEPDLDSEEGAEEADPSPPRAFFEDTAQYEGLPPERRPPRDPDFEA